MPSGGRWRVGTSGPRRRSERRSRTAPPVWRSSRTRRPSCCPEARVQLPVVSRVIFGSKRALADSLDAHQDALVWVGAGHQGVVLEPVVIRQPPLYRRQQRQYRRKRVDAEMAAARNPDVAALGHLERVAGFEPADGASLDSLDDPAQVEQ